MLVSLAGKGLKGSIRAYLPREFTLVCTRYAGKYSALLVQVLENNVGGGQLHSCCYGNSLKTKTFQKHLPRATKHTALPAKPHAFQHKRIMLLTYQQALLPCRKAWEQPVPSPAKLHPHLMPLLSSLPLIHTLLPRWACLNLRWILTAVLSASWQCNCSQRYC